MATTADTMLHDAVHYATAERRETARGVLADYAGDDPRQAAEALSAVLRRMPELVGQVLRDGLLEQLLREGLRVHAQDHAHVPSDSYRRVVEGWTLRVFWHGAVLAECPIAGR